MLEVTLLKYNNYTVNSLTQWDVNQKMKISGLNLETTPTILFSNRMSVTAKPVTAQIENGAIVCSVPNGLLTTAYPIIAYVRVTADGETATVCKIKIPVIPSVKPEDYQYIENITIVTYESLMSKINDLENRKADKTAIEELKTAIEMLRKDVTEVQTTGVTAEVVQAKVSSVIEEMLENGTLTSLMIKEKSIEERHLSDALLSELKQSGIVTDDQGNKYKIKVDSGGGFILERVYDIPRDGLIADICVVYGKCVDSVTGEVVADYTINEDGSFNGVKTLNIVEGNTLSDLTIVMIPKKPTGAFNYTTYFYPNSDTMYGIRQQIIDGTNNSFFDSSKSLSGANSLGAKESYFATMNTQLLTGDTFEFVAFARDTAELAFRMVQNEVITETELGSSYKDYTSIKLGTAVNFKRFMVYNRALSTEELDILKLSLDFGENDHYYLPYYYFRGLDDLGCPNNIKQLSGKPPEWNDAEVEYETIEHSEPEVTEDMSSFTDLFFLNPVSTLTLNELYNLEAMVYPYNISTDSFNVEYTSSNPSVLACYNGVLIPRKTGIATITAKISNTEITATLDITITEAEVVEENFLEIKESYFYDVLTGEDTIKKINSAIQTAKESGYNGVSFPKMDYHIRPYQKNPHIVIPSDLIIDFNYGSIYVEDNDYCHVTNGRPDQADTGYTLFSFGSFKKGDQYYVPCSNSKVRNLNYYGERYNNSKYTASQYSEFVNSFVFACGGVDHCSIQNINFYNTVGFNVSTGMNGFDQWSGTSEDGAVRGCVRYTDFSLGKLDKTGATISENGDWYCTPEYLKLGYTYGATDYTGMTKYKVGQMNAATIYGLSTRWYEIYWFDKDKRLIEYRTHQMTLETYDLPENAVYFKVNARFPNGAPTSGSEGKVDVPHVIRVFPSVDPDKCYVENCNFYKPHQSAISWTGGTNCVMRNCVAENGDSPLGVWSIDYEDGWQCMRHNIAEKIICTGAFVQPGGHNTAVLNSLIMWARVTNDTELTKFINCAIVRLDQGLKTNHLVENVTYRTINETVNLSTATFRKVNNTQMSDMKIGSGGM